MKNFFVIFGLIVLAIVINSCEEPDSISYPYTYHEIEYLGFKSGLTSSSSDQAFDNGLNEVLLAYIASQPSSQNEIVFDGVTYELANLQAVVGGVPNAIWDQYWEDLDEYSYAIGSCWGYAYAQIPSKGATGTVYVLYTIVTYVSLYGNSEVRYSAVRGNVRPK